MVFLFDLVDMGILVGLSLEFVSSWLMGVVNEYRIMVWNNGLLGYVGLWYMEYEIFGLLYWVIG